ncbi:ABC transporter ATP-binding protein [Nitratireductor indicus]|uniref:Hydroxymethylpyrimidine ABC transporter ATPase component n=1 Tax=Nitratireductor indicus C115 TaxID=1231190 RepID=K2NSJ2_9HYPH|nr:ABC transporter ATP-binding protein [Nitratireductor indicus]EKF40754.1 hydroxymethylpyrimidine ABC transporter ATPase component [Nitratireductor indicus C115]MDS1136415.1 ABC transporter ATP-binding protein [Nitratireductor indicus]SFQ75748.1 NitT/TauT family transport system ATP-binding protein [Nitratireductor indicus]
MSDFVTLESVDLQYGGKGGVLALSGTDMSIRKGEFAAVVGPSGCGKSSLMKLVTGLTPSTAGQIKVDGQTVSGPLKCVGMAFQNPTLLPWRKLLSNVMLPLEIVQPHRGRLMRHRQEYVEKARGLLKMVDLQGFEERHPWELSGGMQQRANLCRALIHNPDLLMLDEPFGALDAFTREELWGVLQDIWMEKRFTTILVTHDLREAAYLADVIYVMSARPGRVIATHRVDLPRPRTLETTFEPRFIEIVHTIRNEIAQIREESRAA